MLHDLFLALSGYPNSCFLFEKNENTDNLFPSICHSLSKKLSLGDQQLIKELLFIGIYAHNIERFVSQNTVINSAFIFALSGGLKESLEDYIEELNTLEKEFLQDPHLGIMSVTARILPFKTTLSQLAALSNKLLDLKFVREHHLLDIMNSYIPVMVLPYQKTFLRLYYQVLTVMYKFIFKWIIEGDLYDPHDDFFVVKTMSETKSALSFEENLTFYEEESYDLDQNKLPEMFNSVIALKIVKIGSRIRNLKRYSLDSEREFMNEYRNKYTDKFQALIITTVKLSSKNWNNIDVISAYQSTYNLASLYDLIIIMDEFSRDRIWDLLKSCQHLTSTLGLLKDVGLFCRGDIFSKIYHQNVHLIRNKFYSHSTSSIYSNMSVLNFPIPEDLNECDRLELDLQIQFNDVLISSGLNEEQAKIFSLHFKSEKNTQSYSELISFEKSTIKPVMNYKTVGDCIELDIELPRNVGMLFSSHSCSGYKEFFNLVFLIRQLHKSLEIDQLYQNRSHEQETECIRFRSNFVRIQMKYFLINILDYIYNCAVRKQTTIFLDRVLSEKDLESVKDEHEAMLVALRSQTFMFHRVLMSRLNDVLIIIREFLISLRTSFDYVCDIETKFRQCFMLFYKTLVEMPFNQVMSVGLNNTTCEFSHLVTKLDFNHYFQNSFK